MSKPITINLKECVSENCSFSIQLDLHHKELFTQSSYEELIQECTGRSFVLAIVPILVKNISSFFCHCFDAYSLKKYKLSELPDRGGKIEAIFWYYFSPQTQSFFYLGKNTELENASRKLFIESYINTSSDDKEIAKVSFFNLGSCYSKGVGVDANLFLAFENFKKAAEMGHTKALCLVGVCYQHGLGVEKNPLLAFQNYQKSVERGYFTAAYHLGRCYQDGIGVDRSSREKAKECDLLAFRLYFQAAQNGHGKSLNALGIIYEKGLLGIDRSTKEKAFNCDRLALLCYEKAAFNWKSKRAFLALGRCYEKGVGAQVNPTQAFACYKKAADSGNVVALYHLALCYLEGIGIEKSSESIQTGLILLKRAWEQGYLLAVNQLGILYLSETHVDRSTKEKAIECDKQAFKYFKLSAERGDPFGLTNLGTCYLIGQGTDQDILFALSCFKQIVSQSESAKINLALCYIVSQENKGDFQATIELLQEIPEKSHCYLTALAILGTLRENMIENGKGEASILYNKLQTLEFRLSPAFLDNLKKIGYPYSFPEFLLPK